MRFLLDESADRGLRGLLPSSVALPLSEQVPQYQVVGLARPGIVQAPEVIPLKSAIRVRIVNEGLEAKLTATVLLESQAQ